MQRFTPALKAPPVPKGLSPDQKKAYARYEAIKAKTNANKRNSLLPVPAAKKGAVRVRVPASSSITKEIAPAKAPSLPAEQPESSSNTMKLAAVGVLALVGIFIWKRKKK